MGVIDFILSSDVDAATRKKGLVLAPLDALPRADTGSASNVDGGDPPEADNASIQQIEDCCRLWRAGMVTPEWFPMLDSIFGTSMSPFADLCEIYLKRHPFRTWLRRQNQAFFAFFPSVLLRARFLNPGTS
jgi:hypothetical protein